MFYIEYNLLYVMLSVSLSVFGANCEYNHIQNVSLRSWICGAVAQHHLFEF